MTPMTIMDARQTIALINEIEHTFPVHQWNVEKVRFWPIVRIKLAWDLTTKHMTTRAHIRTIGYSLPYLFQTIAGKVHDIAKYSAARIKDSSHHSPLRGPVDVVLLGDGISRVKLQGSWYDRLCDPFMDQFQYKGMSFFHLEPNHYYFIPRYRPSLFIGPHLDAIRIKALLSGTAVPCKTDNADRYEAFQRLLADKNVGNSELSLVIIAKRVHTLHALSTYFQSLLATLRPRIGFLVDYPSLEGLAFCLACRNQGIPTVVIQHGVQGDFNEAYGRWMNIPEDGYELLPSIFWCWSQEDAQKINAWSSPAFPLHQAFAGGNLFLDRWRDGTFPIASQYRDAFLDMKASHPATAHILVTLQYGFSSEDHLQTLLMAMKQSPSAWHWWIRLHPMMTNDKAEIEAVLARHHITNYEMDQATGLPLYAVLPNADVHVTLHSAVVIEAESFNVPTVIISETGSVHFQNQIRSGAAVAAYDPDAIINAIKRQVIKRQQTSGHSLAGPERSQDKIDELLVIADSVRYRLAQVH